MDTYLTRRIVNLFTSAHFGRLALSGLLLLGACSGLPPAGHLPRTEAQVDVSRWNRSEGCCQATGKKAAIVSGGSHSSQAGLEILSGGGNLVDAAVAVAFALAVERPHSAGLGGGGFINLKLVQPPVQVFLDFRETAPAKSGPKMYLDAKGQVRPGKLSQDGIFAVGTPGFVAGLWEMHSKWGQMPWKQVLAPAIRLASQGFTVYPTLAQQIQKSKGNLGRLAHTRAIFFSGKRPKGVGDTLVQTDLALSLVRIAEEGADAFYKGEIASRILATVRQYGGLLSAEDLAGYKVKTREPIFVSFGPYQVQTAPPPSAGGVVLAQALASWQGIAPDKRPKTEEAYVHWLAETFKRAYALRAEAIGDPDFVKVPLAELLSQQTTDRIRQESMADKATPAHLIRPGLGAQEKSGTTGFALVDAAGNAISGTITINTRFGSHVMAAKTGIFLNNEMDDFSIKPGTKNAFGLTGGFANAIAPGKRPVSSMMPTLVFEGGRPVLGLTSAGGSRIITTVVQTLFNQLVLFPQDLPRAVFAPRMHHQWLPDKLTLEDGFALDTLNALKARGHRVEEPEWSAVVYAVGQSRGQFTAVYDPREEGGAAAR